MNTQQAPSGWQDDLDSPIKLASMIAQLKKGIKNLNIK